MLGFPDDYEKECWPLPRNWGYPPLLGNWEAETLDKEQGRLIESCRGLWKRPGLRGRTWLTWWRAYRRKWRSSGQSPDMVATEVRRFPLGPQVGLDLHDAGTHVYGKTSWDICKCLRLLLVLMGGTGSRRLYSLCLTSKGTTSTWPCWCHIAAITETNLNANNEVSVTVPMDGKKQI